MTDVKKLELAEYIYDFWRKREHAIFLTANLHGQSPEEIRKWFCEVISTYMNYLHYKMEDAEK